MRAVKSVTIDSERRVIITFLDGSTETLYPNCIWCDSEALRQLIKDLLEEKADAIVQTINNVTIASFADGADEALIKKLLVSIDPIQEGTGDPSPENVRPISGRTGLTIYRSGNDTSNPEEFHVNWESEAGTIYGGTLDIISGKLVVNRGIKVFNGSENWISYSTFSGYYTFLTTMKQGTRQDGSCNMLKLTKSTSPSQTNALWLGVGTKYVYVIGVYESMGSTLADFKSYLSEHNLEVVYPLDIPIEIQLTPQEIITLLGANNIWADSGDILELEYVADTKLYIDESQSATLGSGRQTITSPEIQPVSGKTWEELAEVYKAESEEKETQEETEDERGK